MKEKVWMMETSSYEELTVFQALFCELPQCYLLNISLIHSFTHSFLKY